MGRTLKDAFGRMGKMARAFTMGGKRRTLVVLAVGFIGITACVTLLAYLRALDARRRVWAIHNMKIILVALHNYRDVYGCFPPRAVTDGAGRELYSWRVALLPWVGHPGLYAAFDRSGPYDSPQNRSLGESAPEVYRSPRARSPAHAASYMAVAGSGVWGRTEQKPLSRDPDNSDLVVLIEWPACESPWTAPYDPQLEEVVAYLSRERDTKCPVDMLLGLKWGGVRSLRSVPDVDVLKRLFGPDGGECVRRLETEGVITP